MAFHLHHESKSSSHPLIILVLMVLISQALAQPNLTQPPAPPPAKTLPVPTVILLLFSMLLILFFIFYISYVKQCIDGQSSTAAATADGSDGVATDNNANPPRPKKSKGVEKSVIESFPIIDYSAVKGLRTSKRPLECAVCLSEFEDEDTLRLLPGCRHVYHPECIDAWLNDHASCPVCRSNLADPAVLNGKRMLSMNLDSETFTGGSSVSEGGETSNNIEVLGFDEVRRTHSVSEGWERFTLRLSDEVLKQIESTGKKHRRSVSVQDYTYQGKASWRDGRLWAVLRSISTTKHRRREDSTVEMVSEGNEASVCSSATSSKRLIGYSRRVIGNEISPVGSTRIEMDHSDLPVCNRV